MRVVLLANKSVHTQRWSAGLIERGYDVHVVTIDAAGLPLPGGLTEHFIPAARRAVFPVAGLRLRHLLDRIGPDLLHAHQAIHYGALARRSRFRPTLLSVWGFDVQSWPTKSWLHDRIVRGNLGYADAICATGDTMAAHLASLGVDPATVHVTPFGVDVDLFHPETRTKQVITSPSGAHRRVVTVGTVKTLAPEYGIDILLRAFAIARDRLENAGGEISLHSARAEPDYQSARSVGDQIRNRPCPSSRARPR